MLDGVGDRCCSPDVDTSQRKSIQPEPSNDRLEIPDPCFKTEVLYVSVGRSHPTNVVADDPPTETDQSVRDFPSVRPSDPVAVQLAEDIGREHERRAIAKAGKGDTDAIARRGVLHRQGDQRHSSRRSRTERQQFAPIVSPILWRHYQGWNIKGPHLCP
jgi:hypothetical protein